MQIIKPPHNRYALSGLDNSTYVKYATVYSRCKKWGIKGVYAFVGGTNLWGVVTDVTKGTLVQYGKRRIATVVITGASYICAPAVAVVTNATRVVKTCKVVYTSIGFVMEAVEDASQITFLPLDMVLFGQPIPANTEGRYSSWSNVTDLIANLPSFEDD